MADLTKNITVKVGGIAKPVRTESSAAFCERTGISMQGLSYARRNGLVDFFTDGSTNVVLLTEKTLAYVPNPHPSRPVPVKTRKYVDKGKA